MNVLRKIWVAGCLACVASASSQLIAAQESTPPPATGQSPTADYTTTIFKASVRRVVVDVVVTDSSGKSVPGLTRDSFSIKEDDKSQKLLSFDANGFGPGMDYEPGKLPPEPVNSFVNLPPTPEKGPLYVLLLDLVNMDNPDQQASPEQHSAQMFARQQLVKFVNDKPEGARFAIFVWSDGLHLVQGFTSDKALLFAAVDPRNPKLHVPRVFLMAPNFGRGDTHATIAVLNHISSFLDGLPGRKNLIWFAGEFPLTLFPSVDGPDGPRYAEQTKATLDLMARNQISIYPVDVRGVVVENYKGPAQDVGGGGAPTVGTPGAAAAGAATQAAAAGQAAGAASGVSLLAGSYMAEDEIAKQTGGRAIYSDNDLKAALTDATENGASYYTLTYSPSNETFDGKLRKIQIDLDKKGYKLAYRRSYYGSDPDAPPLNEKPTKVPPGPPPPRKVGDTLYAIMQHGAPMAHQLVFGVHARAVGHPAMGTPDQMAQLATQPAFFKVRHRNAQPKPLAPIQLQRYSIGYTVLSRQLNLQNAPLNLELAAAAYDADGVMLNAMVDNGSAASAPSASPASSTAIPKSYRAELGLEVPMNAVWIRVGVRDANTDRMGAMEFKVPLAPESESAAATPKGN